MRFQLFFESCNGIGISSGLWDFLFISFIISPHASHPMSVDFLRIFDIVPLPVQFFYFSPWNLEYQSIDWCTKLGFILHFVFTLLSFLSYNSPPPPVTTPQEDLPAVFSMHNGVIPAGVSQQLVLPNYAALKVLLVSSDFLSFSCRIIEGIFRSFNNLQEHFHQSFFMYLLPASDRYISIALYMPVLGGILLGSLLEAVSLWMQTIGMDIETETTNREIVSKAFVSMLMNF